MNQIKRPAPIALLLLSIFMIGFRVNRVIINLENINLVENDVIKWEPRIKPILDSLPNDINQIGYLDQSMITGDANQFDGEELFLMQYSVAPVTLKIGFEESWIIGNFEEDTNLRLWLDENIGRYEIQSFGFGLYLIHKLSE